MDNFKTLIVEDNIQFLHMLYEYLRKITSDIILAEDGISALKFIKIYRPDIVILDLNILGLNGIELLEKIEQDTNLSINVIIVSGELNLINEIP